MKSYRFLLAAFALIFCLEPSTAQAYVGPGSGVTVIGAALSLVGAILLAIVGFVWYPMKRLLRRSRAGSRSQGADTATL